MIKNPPQQLHTPVLLDQTLRLLNPKQGESYLDLTAGYGGHSAAVIARTSAPRQATLVDRDAQAIEQLRQLQSLKGAHILQSAFADAATRLVGQGQRFNMVLVDLGVSSPQLDRPKRGFGFSRDGPLDMRMDQAVGKTAEELVNTASQSELTQIIRRYGEELPSASARIAQAIVQARPLHSTASLAQVIKQTYRGRRTRVHPATRTFQALRIATNDEISQLETVLPLLPDLLSEGGRVVVISFHSLEDRLVKHFFKTAANSGYEATLALLNKKPIAGATEDVHNPRARSSKLRGAVKINTKRKDLFHADQGSQQVTRG